MRAPSPPSTAAKQRRVFRERGGRGRGSQHGPERLLLVRLCKAGDRGRSHSKGTLSSTERMSALVAFGSPCRSQCCHSTLRNRLPIFILYDETCTFPSMDLRLHRRHVGTRDPGQSVKTVALFRWMTAASSGSPVTHFVKMDDDTCLLNVSLLLHQLEPDRRRAVHYWGRPKRGNSYKLWGRTLRYAIGGMYAVSTSLATFVATNYEHVKKTMGEIRHSRQMLDQSLIAEDLLVGTGARLMGVSLVSTQNIVHGRSARLGERAVVAEHNKGISCVPALRRYLPCSPQWRVRIFYA